MTSDISERALVLAPGGRDAFVAREMLGEAGVRGDVVRSIDDLVQALEAGAGCAVVTEEALAGTDLHALSEWLANQPEWSDFPLVLLTQRGGGLERTTAQVLELPPPGVCPRSVLTREEPARSGVDRHARGRPRFGPVPERERRLRAVHGFPRGLEIDPRVGG